MIKIDGDSGIYIMTLGCNLLKIRLLRSSNFISLFSIVNNRLVFHFVVLATARKALSYFAASVALTRLIVGSASPLKRGQQFEPVKSDVLE